MPRPDPRAPGAGQSELFEPSEPVGQKRAGQVLRGRHSVAVDAALDAARAQQVVTDVDEAAATLLRAGAWSLDAFEAQNKPYGPSKIIPALTEALRELHMTPESRQTGTTDGAIAELLRDLNTLEDVNGDATVHHTPE